MQLQLLVSLAVALLRRNVGSLLLLTSLLFATVSAQTNNYPAKFDHIKALTLQVTSPVSMAGYIPMLPAVFSVPYAGGAIRLTRPPLEEEGGCFPFSANSSQGVPWFGNAMYLVPPEMASCSHGQLILQLQRRAQGLQAKPIRVYHASLVGVKLIVLVDPTLYLRRTDEEILQLTAGTSFEQMRYGTSQDPTLNVSQWLLDQPAGMGYKFQSPYPEPAVISIRAVDNIAIGPNIRLNTFPYGNPGKVVMMVSMGNGIQDLIPSQKRALLHLAEGFKFPSTESLEGYGSGKSWSVWLSDPDANPCALGLIGLWCENGVVRSIVLEDIALSGTLSDSIGALVNMTLLRLVGNGLRGALPTSLCNLTNIVQIEVISQELTEFPDCWCGSPSMDRLTNPTTIVNPITNVSFPLATVRISFNKLRRFPVSLLACARMQILEASLNQFDQTHSILPDVISIRWPKLLTLDLTDSGIQFAGVIPNFRNMIIETIKLGRNPRSFYILRNDTFLNSPALITVVLNELNLASSPWPNLKGTLITLDLTNCGLSGRMVVGSSTVDLTVRLLYISGNTLLMDDDGTYPLLRRVTNVVDSVFKISRLGLKCGRFTDFGSWLNANIPATAPADIDLSGNELHECPWKDNWSLFASNSRFVNMKKLNVSGNQVRMLPSSLFQRNAVISWTELDVSNCSISGPLPPMLAPYASLRYLNARMNPNLFADEKVNYIQPDYSQPYISSNGLLCPQFTFPSTPSALVLMDYSINKYLDCSCDRGLFGVPPNCTALPSSLLWSYDDQPTATISAQVGTSPGLFEGYSRLVENAIVPSVPAGQALSDGFFGDLRYSQGMLTNFVISPASAAATPATVISIHLLLNAGTFDSYTDILSVFEGGDDLSGDRVFSIHGSDQVLKAGISAFESGKQQHDISATDETEATESDYETSVVSGTLRYVNVNNDPTTIDSGGQIAVYTFNLSASSSPHEAILSSLLQSVGPVNGHSYLKTVFPGVQLVHALTIRVFAPTATLQFNSFDAAGLHFVATYSSSTTCPEGLTFFGGKCMTEVRARVEVRSAVFAVGGVTALLTVLCAVSVYFWSESNVMRAASPSILLFQCVCMLLLCCGSMLFAVVPSSTTYPDAVCHLRVWLTAVPLIGILAVLVAKSHRVVSIFTTESLKPRRVTEKDVAKWVAALILLQVAICAVFSGWSSMTTENISTNGVSGTADTAVSIIGLSRSLVSPGTGDQSLVLVHRCSRESGFYPWLSVQLLFVFLLAGWGGVLAFRTRDVLSQFNDSVHVANALFTLIFVGAIAVPVTILVQSDMDATVLLQGLAAQIMVIAFAVTIFLPKAYYCATGRTLQAVAAITGQKHQVKTAAAPAVKTKDQQQEQEKAKDRESEPGGEPQPQDVLKQPMADPNMLKRAASLPRLKDGLGREGLAIGVHLDHQNHKTRDGNDVREFAGGRHLQSAFPSPEGMFGISPSATAQASQAVGANGRGDSNRYKYKLDSRVIQLSQCNPLSHLGPDSSAHPLTDNVSLLEAVASMEGITQSRFIITHPRAQIHPSRVEALQPLQLLREEFPGAVESMSQGSGSHNLSQVGIALRLPSPTSVHQGQTPAAIPTAGSSSPSHALQLPAASSPSLPSSENADSDEFLTARSQSSQTPRSNSKETNQTTPTGQSEAVSEEIQLEVGGEAPSHDH